MKTRLRRLGSFPESGQKLFDAWDGFRYTRGRWRSMLIVFVFDEVADDVIVAMIQDRRSASAVTSERA